MFVYILIWEIDYHKKLLGIFCQFKYIFEIKINPAFSRYATIISVQKLT